METRSVRSGAVLLTFKSSHYTLAQRGKGKAMPKATMSRRNVLVGAAAASATIGATLPADAAIAPRLVNLLKQRERLDAEITRLAAPVRDLFPSPPESIRIDPTEATFEFLSSGCDSFHTTSVHGEACLWATGAWWADRDDDKREQAAATYADASSPVWEGLGQTPSGYHVDDLIIDRIYDLGKLETEILRSDPTSIAELRLLAQVACDQYLRGKADFFPLRILRGILNVT